MINITILNFIAKIINITLYHFIKKSLNGGSPEILIIIIRLDTSFKFMRVLVLIHESVFEE